MAIPIENWGQLKISAGVKEEASGAQPSAMLELVSLPKNDERSSGNFVSRPLVSIPIQAIASASGTTKNDISLSLQQRSSLTQTSKGNLELVSVRFAVPNSCVGYDQTEEAGRELLQDVQDAIRTQHASILGDSKSESAILKFATLASGEHHDDEVIVCVFDDVTFSSPSGKYKLIVSNYHVVLEDKKKGSGPLSLSLSDIAQIYLCNVPTNFSKNGSDESEDDQAHYVVLILKKPLKIRSALYAHLVISCPPDLVLDENHPWKCELSTQEEINKVLKFEQREGVDFPVTPAMSGRVSEILLRAFKGIAKVPAYGGVNKEYRSVLTQHQQSCMRALYRSAEGLLYVVNGGLLFLHRPALKLAFADITRVEVDESESGVAMFKLEVFVQSEKYVFSGIDKAEKDGLIQYLSKVTKLVHHGLNSDDEEDDEDDEDDEDEDDSGDDEGSEEEEEGEKKHKHRKRHHKHHHKHHHKKDKKHRKEE